MDNFKGDFHKVSIFFAPSDSKFANSYLSQTLSYPKKKTYQWKAYVFCFQMMYRSQFKKKKYPCDWFVVQGHI